MISNLRLFITVLLVLVPMFSTMGQDRYPAWWSGFAIEKELTKEISLELEPEWRYLLDEDETDRFSTSLNVDYAFNKKWKFGVGYTWIHDHDIDDDEYANRNRYSLFVRHKRVFGNWSMSLREKFQSTYYDADNDNKKYDPKNALRSKLEVCYKIKLLHIKPYISGQFRYQLNNPDGNEIDNFRWAFGTDYEISKTVSADFYCQYDKVVNVKEPEAGWVLGTSLKFEF
ncbi:DUF2490 domain-containing protein [Geofilum sp. OHC36d9]|uniref:DUF2490 domain-containing protein n=1 Tax=Geofilum sp. OHC36d9 TaxID=3458413 RepID=UPI00403430B0